MTREGFPLQFVAFLRDQSGHGAWSARSRDYINAEDLTAPAIANPIKAVMGGKSVISNEYLITLIDGSIAKRLISPVVMFGFAIVLLIYGVFFGLMIGNPGLFQGAAGGFIFMAIMAAIMGFLMFSEGGGIGK